MAKIPSDEEIERRVREVFGRVLIMDPMDIRPEMRIASELGAKSVDLVEIVLDLATEFCLLIPQEHLFPEITDEIVDADGFLTGTGIGLIFVAARGASMVHLDLEPGRRMDDLQTVAMVCRYVKDRLTNANMPTDGAV